MKKDIYHYYFDFDKHISEVVKEQYEEEIENSDMFDFGKYKYGDGNYIRLYTKGERHCKVIPKDSIGTVINGKYILLYERDDEKARQLFLDYLYTDILKQYERLSRFIEKYDFFGSQPILEGIYDKEVARS